MVWSKPVCFLSCYGVGLGLDNKSNKNACLCAPRAYIKVVAICTRPCSPNRRTVFVSVKLLLIRPVHLKVEEPCFWK